MNRQDSDLWAELQTAMNEQLAGMVPPNPPVTDDAETRSRNARVSPVNPWTSNGRKRTMNDLFPRTLSEWVAMFCCFAITALIAVMVCDPPAVFGFVMGLLS